MNKALLIGRVGKEPEVKTLESGTKVAKCTLATSHRKDLPADWHNLVFFGKVADIAEKFIAKGDRIHVEGRIQTRSYESGGEKKYITEIVVSNIELLGKTEKLPTPEDYKKDHQGVEEKDDLPF